MSYTLLSKSVRFFYDFHCIDIPIACFSLTRWTSPKWPRPITFLSSKSPTFTRNFLSLVTTGWSINVNNQIRKQKTKSYEISYINLSTKLTVWISLLVTSVCNALIIQYQQCIYDEPIFCQLTLIFVIKQISPPQ